MTANSIQVGGDHYRVEYQHWDWVVDNRIGYLPGNSTKYIFRWKRKNGVQDLEKADHYIIKMVESFEKGVYINESRTISEDQIVRRMSINNTKKFIESNDLDTQQENLILLLDGWTTVNDLSIARRILQEYTRSAVEQAAMPGGQAAPTIPGRPTTGLQRPAYGATTATQRRAGRQAASNASVELINCPSCGGTGVRKFQTCHMCGGNKKVVAPKPFGYPGDG